jgi:NAD(P)H-dependent FMN reductase
MTRIGIILGSTRPGRKSEGVAEWILEAGRQRDDAEFELVDLRDFPLPFFDEVMSPAYAPSESEQVKAWAATIASFDGFVFVTPEYNHSTTGVLKNALDYLYKEWNNKSVGFAAYGALGGTRAVEHLRLIASELEMATVRHQVGLSILTDYENYTDLVPSAFQVQARDKMLDQVVVWADALAPLRAAAEVAAA